MYKPTHSTRQTKRPLTVQEDLGSSERQLLNRLVLQPPELVNHAGPPIASPAGTKMADFRFYTGSPAPVGGHRGVGGVRAALPLVENTLIFSLNYSY